MIREWFLARKKVILLPLLLLAAGYLAMRILLSFKEEPPRQAPLPRTRSVEARVVRKDDVPTRITAYGRLTSAQPVILYSEVSGTIQKGDVPFQPAQSFRRGDLLLKIDDRQVRLDLNSTKSDFLTALATLLPEIKIDFPEEYTRWQDYFDSCEFDRTLTPLPEVRNEQIKLFLSRFNVYKLYFAVRNLEIILNKHLFYATFDGSIVSTDLRVGSTARNGSRLGEIINLEHLEVEVPVTAEDLDWLDREKPVFLTSAEIAGRWTGRILRTGRSIDDRTQTVPVFISVDHSEDDNLISGVFLKADIPGRIVGEAVSIPRKSIYDERYVYLIRGGKLDYRALQIARKGADAYIATGGIEEGDTLVVDVLQGVSPGMLATPRFPDSEKDFADE
jgi:multidrug efflux pump subunit AcrA (membrane-fusion protein)